MLGLTADLLTRPNAGKMEAMELEEHSHDNSEFYHKVMDLKCYYFLVGQQAAMFINLKSLTILAADS